MAKFNPSLHDGVEEDADDDHKESPLDSVSLNIIIVVECSDSIPESESRGRSSNKVSERYR